MDPSELGTTPPRAFGCPMANGFFNGQAAATRRTNGQVNGNGNGAAVDRNFNLSLHEKDTREIPRGGMLYGDYLQVIY